MERQERPERQEPQERSDEEEARDLQRVASRADELLPEEQRAGSDDPAAQAAEILGESDERVDHRSSPGSQPVEHRRSEDTVDHTDDT